MSSHSPMGSDLPVPDSALPAHLPPAHLPPAHLRALGGRFCHGLLVLAVLPILVTCSDGGVAPTDPLPDPAWAHPAVPAALLPLMEDLENRILPALDGASLAAGYDTYAQELRAGWELNNPQRVRDAVLGAATLAGRQLAREAGNAAPEVGALVIALHAVAAHSNVPGELVSAALGMGAGSS